MRNGSNRQPNRQGVSLVELLISMTIASVVLGTGLGALHLLLRTDQNMERSLQWNQTVSRLSRVFREDVSSAESSKGIQDAELVLNLAGDREVRYRVESHHLTRTETGTNPSRIEIFRFSPQTKISIGKVNSIMTITIHSANRTSTKHRNPLPTGKMHELAISAHLGRDERFQTPLPSVGDTP